MTSTSSMKSVLVYAANGVQGRAVVRAALDRGFFVRALVRNPARAYHLIAAGAELAVGDLDDAASLQSACAGVRHAVLQIPIGPMAAMRQRAEHALAAAKAGGLRSLILKLSGASRPAPCDEPSFLANAMLEAMVARSGLRWAVIRPTMYLDNLLKPSAIADIAAIGAFRPPIAAGQRIAWTCVDDCAQAAVMLLERGAYGGDHRIAGRDGVTGHELMARISIGLGQRLVYEPQAIEAFVAEVDRAMGQGVGVRVASKFRFFESHPIEADRMLAESFVPMPGLADFEPIAIEDWARAHRGSLLGAAPHGL